MSDSVMGSNLPKGTKSIHLRALIALNVLQRSDSHLFRLMQNLAVVLI